LKFKREPGTKVEEPQSRRRCHRVASEIAVSKEDHQSEGLTNKVLYEEVERKRKRNERKQ